MTLFRARDNPRLGVFLRFTMPDMADTYEALKADSDAIANESGLKLRWEDTENGSEQYAWIGSYRVFPELDDPATFPDQWEWFQRAANGMVRALRPRLAKLQEP
jgi:hypothetical protein